MGGSGVDKSTNGVLTIGHFNHAQDVFLELLVRHRVTALADVRSAPYSRFNPQFNREPIAAVLKACGIGYVHLGRELGGRSDDRSCYEHGRVRYDRVADTPRFRAGLRRIVRGSDEHRVALMCAEKEPLHCHRTLLIGHELDKRGVDVAHILADGALEPHAGAMARLLALFDLEVGGDLFHRNEPRSARVAEAIARQAKRVGHAVDHRAGPWAGEEP